VDHPEIGQRLCVFHKLRNCLKKLDTVTKDPKMDAETICLFQKIVCGRRLDGADKTVVQLKQLLPGLDHDIATEIAGYLAHCSEAYHGQVLILGINDTGGVESTDNMMKSSPGSPHFIGIREAYSRKHEFKTVDWQAKVVRQFQTTHSLREVHGLELSGPILKGIDLFIGRSHAWAIQKTHDRPHAYGAWHRKKERCWELLYDEHNPRNVSATKPAALVSLVPIIALFRERGPKGVLPVQSIAPHWFPKSPKGLLPPLPTLCFGEIDQVGAILMISVTEDETDRDSDSGDDERMTSQGRE
jgi:hypothetical protein